METSTQNGVCRQKFLLSWFFNYIFYIYVLNYSNASHKNARLSVKPEESLYVTYKRDMLILLPCWAAGSRRCNRMELRTGRQARERKTGLRSYHEETCILFNGFPILFGRPVKDIKFGFSGTFWSLFKFVISAPRSVWWQSMWFWRPHLGSFERHWKVWNCAAFVCLCWHCLGEDAAVRESQHPEELLHLPINSSYHSKWALHSKQRTWVMSLSEVCTGHFAELRKYFGILGQAC